MRTVNSSSGAFWKRGTISDHFGTNILWLKRTWSSCFLDKHLKVFNYITLPQSYINSLNIKSRPKIMRLNCHLSFYSSQSVWMVDCAKLKHVLSNFGLSVLQHCWRQTMSFRANAFSERHFFVDGRYLTIFNLLQLLPCLEGLRASS